MDGEHELDLERIDNDIENNNRVEKRIKDLSEKVRLTAEERDEKDKLVKERDDKISRLEKENQFLGSFSDQASRYPDALQFKDKIKEKVLKGYSVEDATVAVLNQEGKFQSQPKVVEKPPVQPENPAGGSAAVTPPATEGPKSINEMSREEKRQALLDAERRGDISLN